MPASPNYWLFKSEPDSFSIQDLAAAPRKTTCWDGVRNYQARNFLRDQIKPGDGVLFYHSSTNPPAVAGTATVVKAGYPDRRLGRSRTTISIRNLRPRARPGTWWTLSWKRFLLSRFHWSVCARKWGSKDGVAAARLAPEHSAGDGERVRHDPEARARSEKAKVGPVLGGEFPLDWIDDELAELDAQGLRREQKAHSGAQGPEVEIAGRRCLNFGSNDYLGLAADARLAAAARTALDVAGWGSAASPLLAGRSTLHARLEAELAQFERAEATMLFSSGFAANLAVIPAVVGRGDVVFSDEINHASLIDGCRLSRAQVLVYPHNDWRKLEELLKGARLARRRLIVTDALFSMDGDLAPLVELADLARRHDCMLMVDEAHATGVFGPTGRGVAEHFGVSEQVDIRMGTLSKGLGGIGGFICGRRVLIDWLTNRARAYVFSTAMPAAACAASLAALEIVRDEPQRRISLLAEAARLRTTLASQGWNVGESASQIIRFWLVIRNRL